MPAVTKIRGRPFCERHAKIVYGSARVLWGLLVSLLIAGPVWAASTIDPTQPPQGQPYNSAPIRNNFQSAILDIQALQGSNIGPSAPFPCNLANQGRWWINNTAPAAWAYNVCDGPGGTWNTVFVVNPQTHQVTGPPSSPNQRVEVASPITFYVLPSGTDANNTCTNPSTPCATIQNTVNKIRNNYDLNGFPATVQLLNTGVTTYTENVNISGPFLGAANPSSVVINGNAGSPSSVVLNATDPILVTHGAYATVQNLTVQASDDCIDASKFGQVVISNVTFAGCANNGSLAYSNGLVNFVGTNTISAGGSCFTKAQDMSLNSMVPKEVTTNTFVLTDTPAFTQGFVCAARLAQIRAVGAIFSGPASGPRCFATDNAVVYTATSGNATFFPGTSPCTPTNGALYD